MRWNRLVPGSLAILAGCAGTAGSGTGEPPCAIRVASGPELAAALARPGCGARIVLADGSYQGDFALRNPCPVDLPITVQAEHPLATVLQCGWWSRATTRRSAACASRGLTRA